ncbi:hexosaminidase D-like [Ostrinia nubilalis]|uniref:hexosaminidase D-like n=1 Tax=Ostrinia nubilalis TaxID=29057 RepID=UPI0030823DB5
MAGNMQRVVHLDLKGAPPKIDFLEKVLLIIKSCGGTGVLIEWEDTFPYEGELADIGSHGNSGGDGVYKPEEVQHIFNFIKANGLLPIQLIQTFSHLEFVLKHPKFAKLRELHESPACLCPCKPDSLPLVTAMVEQALNAQPDAEYVHIGADEIWHLGVCPDCQSRIAGDVDGTAVLYLDHILAVANYVRSIRPNITILMWDDMLRGIKTDILLRYDLGSKVQPVIWDYSPKEVFHIGAPRWNVYSQLFPRVWAASAFKGASGANQILASTYRYVSNNEAWLNEIKHNAPGTVFAGIILTGWSRYDHYATLCELLPVAMPSLVSCLSLLTKPEDVPIEIH